MSPNAPVYIVSKGRWDYSFTSRVLDAMGLRHYVIVEEREQSAYRAALPPTATVLVLDPEYLRRYETCDDHGDTKSKGPGAARNYAWDHSFEHGATWHWVMDDNISHFYRLHRNIKWRVGTPVIFRAMEDWCARYENIAIGGPNYETFAHRKWPIKPFALNTRIYSCLLIRNAIPYRWRARYNEDTDLALRVLKDRWCTVQFNAFLQHKMRTQTVPGGNTRDFYQREGTLPKSQMLVKLHPDVTRLVKRFGRDHHFVDYRRFKVNRLRRRPDVEIPAGVNEYGMRLIATPDSRESEGVPSV
jgi:hypothetical protein